MTGTGPEGIHDRADVTAVADHLTNRLAVAEEVADVGVGEVSSVGDPVGSILGKLVDDTIDGEVGVANGVDRRGQVIRKSWCRQAQNGRDEQKKCCFSHEGAAEGRSLDLCPQTQPGNFCEVAKSGFAPLPPSEAANTARYNCSVPNHRLTRRLWLLSLVLVTACGSALPNAPETTAARPSSSTAIPGRSADEPPEWLSLSARYSPRHSLGKRRLDIVTTNSGATEIVVSRIALRAEHFHDLSPENKETLIGPGATVDIKTDFGEVVNCGIAESLEASVLIEVTVGSGAPGQYLVAVDPEPLDVIRASDCGAQIVRDTVGVSFEDVWTVDGMSVMTQLVLERNAGDETVTITALRGMILYGMHAVQPTGQPIAVLPPGIESLSVPVVMTLARCDTHAVSQAPDGYSFRVWVAVGDHDAQLVTVFPDSRLQEQLEDLVLTCLEGSTDLIP